MTQQQGPQQPALPAAQQAPQADAERDRTWPNERPLDLTLDALLDDFNAAPTSFTPKLFVVRNRGGMLGRSVPHVDLVPGVTRYDVEQALARIVKAPTYLLARLRKDNRYTGYVEVDLSDPAWFAAAAAPAASPASAPSSPPSWPPPPPGWPQQPWPAVPQLPPMDMTALFLQSMQSSQQLLMQLVMREPKPDPALAVMRSEIDRLTRALETATTAPAKKEKEEREELIDLGKKLASGSGVSEAAVQLLAGPIDKLANAMATAAETRAKIELRNAETRQLEAATKAAAAGLPTTETDDDEKQETAQA